MLNGKMCSISPHPQNQEQPCPGGSSQWDKEEEKEERKRNKIVSILRQHDCVWEIQ